MMLAHKYNPAKHSIGGWYLSEKLDGQRCFWDGGISRGKLKSDIYWANTAKDSRYVDTQYATGLWSRYGNVIHAPDEWLDKLPKMPLDGELYLPYDRQTLRTIIARLDPNPNEWREVFYYVFDIPCMSVMLKEGEIKTTNFKKVLKPDLKFDDRPEDFRHNYKILCDLEESPYIRVVDQQKLPMQTNLAEEMIREELEAVTNMGGEGVMLRNPDSYWVPWRTHDLVKVKKLSDMEGTVIGYTTGRETELGSKLLGKMGALILRLDNGKTMELSGFTDLERELECTTGFGCREATDWAVANPGGMLPDEYQARAFPRGTRVTFRYRGMSNDGIPQEARYWRKKDDE